MMLKFCFKIFSGSSGGGVDDATIDDMWHAGHVLKLGGEYMGIHYTSLSTYCLKFSIIKKN